MTRPTPLDAPREFRINEMFFSTTDRRGVIRSGNDVFVRVSGYAHDQLVGAPHNLIRHPAMPRAVFRLVWRHLLDGQPVAGLVKNMASDGKHYWVVAFLMPVSGGFLSIRFKPSSELLPAVEGVYREMSACEAAAADGSAGMDAAEERLGQALRGLGWESYEAFMRTLLHDELKSRDAVLARQQLRLFPAELPRVADGGAAAAGLRAIHMSGQQAYQQINTLYAQLDDFAQLNEHLGEKSTFVLGLTKDFRFIAFNAALRSARLGEEGRGLSVIADYLSTSSANTTRVVGGLTEQIGAISAKLRVAIFNLAAARLQIEMVLGFCAELVERPDGEPGSGASRQRMVQDLQAAFAETIERAMRALADLEKDLGLLGASAEEMRRLVLTLQVAQVGGLVEASRLHNDDSFTVLFAELRHGVENTKKALAELDEASLRLQGLSGQTAGVSTAITQAVAEMAQGVEHLTIRDAVASPRPASIPVTAQRPRRARESEQTEAGVN